MKELKYLFNWGSSFWLILFWRCSLKFLSIIIVPVSWGAVFDLEISSWLLTDIKLSTLFFHFVFHFWFLVTVLPGIPLINSLQCLGNYFLEKLSISFWTFDKFVTFFDTLETHKSIKWINWFTYHRKESQNTQKNDKILSLHIFLASFFTRRPI